MLSPFLITAQQVSDFENVEELGSKSFWAKYVKGLFSDFTDLGDPFVLNGGLGLNARTYNAWGTDNRQPPFYWILNANANISIYKLNIPFSALISLNQLEVTKPQAPGLPPVKDNVTNRFNRIGFSPYYKWLKLHAGHRNMTFSQFTLSNLTYLGGGVELNPGNIRLAAMYGRLAKAEPQDLSLLEPNLPVFQRMGWGVKLGYGSESEFIDFMIFNGWDDENSIPEPIPQEVFVNENLVIGIKAQKTFFEKFSLMVDYANSALTPDISDAPAANQFPHPAFLLDGRQNTIYSNALETSVDYAGQGYNLGLKYRRIDPDYKSLGAYFFNNDIEDIAGNASWSLFNQAVQIAVSAGVQQDNLDNSKASTLTRFIGSGNINYTKDKFNLGLNYSNYSSDIEFVFDLELDSLNVVVVTQDLGANASYAIEGESGNQHTFTLATAVQSVVDDMEDPQQSAESKMFNANLGYVYTLSETGWNFTANANYNQNQLAQMDVNRWGLGGGVSKSFLENKLNLGLNVNYFKASVETITNIENATLNLRLRMNYKISDPLSLNLNYSLMNRQKSDDTGNEESITEVIGTLGVRYNFAWQPEFKKDKKPPGD